jgi:hypothetical protein
MRQNPKLSNLFKQNGVDYLNYIANLRHINNILNNGILSRNKIIECEIDISNTDISEEKYQMKRAKNLKKKSISVHDYVPLYIATHTPMLHRVCIAQKRRKQICIIKISLDILNKEEIYYSNLNCSCEEVRIFTDIDGIDQLDWNVIKNWRGYDWINKKKKGAEVLVPERIEPLYFKEIIVYSRNLLKLISVPVKYKDSIIIRYDKREFY